MKGITTNSSQPTESNQIRNASAVTGRCGTSSPSHDASCVPTEVIEPLSPDAVVPSRLPGSDRGSQGTGACSMVVAAAVVFDLGGVLIDWNPEYLYRKVIPDADQRREFLTTICTPQWNREMDEGRSVPEAVAALSDANPGYEPLVEAWWARWPEMLGGEVPGTRTLVEALARTGLPLYALTNWSAETWPLGVQQYPFLEELFDGIVVSGQERIAKPDPQLFAILSDRFDLDPHTTAYVDDSSANIATASGLGYIAHLFTTADRLHGWLTEIGLLDAR